MRLAPETRVIQRLTKAARSSVNEVQVPLTTMSELAVIVLCYFYGIISGYWIKTKHRISN